ncbi:MAG: hypothetical protein IT323_10730 [Anaerolineae bacterium]|nr:hypothetical protein [Anaerolineae bacterium]
MRKLLGTLIPLLGAGLLLMVGACTGSSQAASVLESDNISLRATIAFYEALGPTMTADSALMQQQLATVQAALDQSRQEVRNLTVRVNGMTQPGTVVALNTTPLAAADPNAAAQAGQPALPTLPADTGDGFGSVRATPTPLPLAVTTPQGGPVSVSSASGMMLDEIVTARGQDEDGCAVDQTTTFSASGDARILVITVARNFRSGTLFMTRWQGPNDFLQQYEWTSDSGAESMCVHFYIEPASLQMAPGEYTVTFVASDNSGTIESAPIPFTVTQ